MAIHVNTWDAFLEALTAATAQEIYVDADMDASEWESEKVQITGATVVHGQGHTIRNILYDHEENLFFAMGTGTPEQTIYFSDLNFVNVMTTMRQDYAFINARNSRMNFTNCKFQGLFVRFAYRSCTFNQCTFAFAQGLFLALWVGGTLNCNECYFDFGTQSRNDTPVMWAESGTINLNNCYLKGTILATNKIFDVSLSNSVINVFCSPTGELFTVCNNTSGVSLYNSSRIDGTPSSVQDVIGLTDSELKDADSVVATGFPLVT